VRIRLVDAELSFVVHLKHSSAESVLLNQLNPLSADYVGKTFRLMGVKPIVQNLVVMNVSSSGVNMPGSVVMPMR
jgi:hypothetical protein